VHFIFDQIALIQERGIEFLANNVQEYWSFRNPLIKKFKYEVYQLN